MLLPPANEGSVFSRICLSVCMSVHRLVHFGLRLKDPLGFFCFLFVNKIDVSKTERITYGLTYQFTCHKKEVTISVFHIMTQLKSFISNIFAGHLFQTQDLWNCLLPRDHTKKFKLYIHVYIKFNWVTLNKIGKERSTTAVILCWIFQVTSGNLWVALIYEWIFTPHMFPSGQMYRSSPTQGHLTSLAFYVKQARARDGRRCVCLHWVTDGKEKVKRRFKWRSCSSLSLLMWWRICQFDTNRVALI